MRLDHMYFSLLQGGISRQEFMEALAAHPGGAAGAARVEAPYGTSKSKWMYFGRDMVAQLYCWNPMDEKQLHVLDLEAVRADRLRKRAFRAACNAEWEPLHEAAKAAIVATLYEGRKVLYIEGQQGGSFRLDPSSPRVSARGVLNLLRGRKCSQEELVEFLLAHGADLMWQPFDWQWFGIAADPEPPVPWGAAATRRNPIEFDRVLAG